MKISLIMATLGRVDEVVVLLDSLRKQTYKNFELIVIDQNAHFKIQNIINRYTNDFEIKYIRSDIKGLSYNRNIGIQYCSGDIIAFPDDDCFYSENLLEEVYNTFKEAKNKIVLVEACDNITQKVFIKKVNDVSRKQIMRYAISYNIFALLNREVTFDENLGVGCFFSSGEETDYLWQLVDRKEKIIFVKKGKVFHLENAASVNYNRAYSYGLGFGALFKKEILKRNNYDYIFVYIKYLIRSFAGIILTSKKKFYWETLKGRIKGFLLFKV